MTSQTRRAASQSTDDRAAPGASAFASLGEISRQQMATAADTLGTLFRAQEAFLQAQLHMGQRAALMHRQAAESLRAAGSPAEVLTVQSTLLVAEWQEAMRYWQEVMLATSRAAKAVDAGATLAEPAAPPQSPAAQAMEAAITAAGPMADAFQQMFAAPFRAAAQRH